MLLKEKEARRFQGKEQYLQSQGNREQQGKAGMRLSPEASAALCWLLFSSLFTHIELHSQLFQGPDACHPDCFVPCLFFHSPLLGPLVLPQAAGICWTPDKAWEVAQ